MSEIHSDYYKKHYWNVHYKGLLGIFTNGYHKKIEKTRGTNCSYQNVLEIGGGTGEHLRFVNHSFAAYTLLDIAENTEGLERIALDHRSSQIKFVVADASSIPFSDSSFERVVSTCVLHHVASVEDVLREIRRVSKDGAVVDLYLPCDPGLMYRWIRHWTSHLKQKKSMKLNWTEVKYLWALEHRNHYLGIYSLIRGVFRNDQIKLSRHPLPILSWNLNLYSIIRITVAKGDVNQSLS